MRRAVLVVSLAVLSASAAVGQEAQEGPPLTAPPPGVSLTGRWELDPKLSGDPGDQTRGAMKRLQSEPRPPYPPVYPRPPGAPGDRDNRPVPTGPGIDITTPGMTAPPTDDPFRRGGTSRSSRSQYRAPSEYVSDLPKILTIAQRPSMILIQEDDDESRTRALLPDGARHPSTDGESEHRTRWENGLLHVETFHDDGVEVEEIFELAPDRSLLTVTVKVDDGGDAVSVERVFKPAPIPEA